MFKLDVKKMVILQASEQWTDEELAKRANLSRSSITKIRHRQHNASNMAISRIAKALGVGIEDIAEWVE